MSNHATEFARVTGVESNERRPQATPDLAEFKAYTRRKQEVAEALRTLLDVFRHGGDEANAQQCREGRIDELGELPESPP